MDIVLITDNNYVIPTYITIFSAAINYKGNDELIAHICGVDLNADSISTFNELRDECNIVIHNISLDSFEDKLKKIKQHTHVTPAALIKFELPNMLVDLSKVLYMDGDIVVKKDISELNDIDISNYELAAVHDFWKTIDDFNSKGKIDYDCFYFNSGLMLMNLNMLRTNGITKQLWSEKLLQSKLKNKSTLMDQNVFNSICGNKTLKLSIKYNFNVAFSDYTDIKLINEIYNTKYKTIDELVEDGVVMHYVGKHDKPWVYSNSKCRNIWMKYFVESGLDGALISNKKYKKDLNYYILRTRRHIKQKGLINTGLYLIRKKRNSKNV